VLLLHPIASTAPATVEVAAPLPRRLADALRRTCSVEVVFFEGGSPAVPAASVTGDPDAASPSAPLAVSPETARTARTLRATHLLYGALSTVAAPDGPPARLALRLTLASVDGTSPRTLSVEISPGRRSKPEGSATALARAAATAFRRDWLASLDTKAAESDTLEGRVRRGKEALAAEDLEEAGRLLEAAIRQAPNDPRANVALGDLQARRGRLAAAISHYRRALLFDRSDAEAWNQLLHALEAHGDRVDLAREARAAREAGREDPVVWRALALGALAEGRATEAEAAFGELLRRGPADGVLVRARALLWATTGRAGEAARLLETYIRDTGERQQEGLLASIRALPEDPLVEFRDRLPDTTHGVAREILARGAGLDAAASGEGGEVRQRRVVLLAAQAHALRESASPQQAAPTEFLTLLARAALAQAVAEIQPWPGGRALAARLREEAAARLRAGRQASRAGFRWDGS
jgi:tetratricopeptide (TPR) repeat protein